MSPCDAAESPERSGVSSLATVSPTTSRQSRGAGPVASSTPFLCRSPRVSHCLTCAPWTGRETPRNGLGERLGRRRAIPGPAAASRESETRVARLQVPRRRQTTVALSFASLRFARRGRAARARVSSGSRARGAEPSFVSRPDAVFRRGSGRLRVTPETLVIVHNGGNDVLVRILPLWWIIWLDLFRLIVWDASKRSAVLRPFCGVRRGRGDVDFERCRGPTFFGVFPRRSIEQLRHTLLDIHDAFRPKTLLVSGMPINGSLPLAQGLMSRALFRSLGQSRGNAVLHRLGDVLNTYHRAMLRDVAEMTNMTIHFYDEATSIRVHAAKGPAAFWLDSYHPSSFGHAMMAQDAIAALDLGDDEARDARARNQGVEVPQTATKWAT